MPDRLIFTLFGSARSASGRPEARAWAEWVEELSPREVREAKDGPCLVLGEIASGKRRSAANVRAAHAIGIDLEKAPEAAIEAAFAAIAPFEWVAYTTHSHAPSAPRLRIVLPFARPIEPSDYPAVWAGLNRMIGGINDPQTKDISRLHYLPSCPPGAEAHHATWANRTGRLIDPDDVPDVPIAQPEAPPADDPMAARRLAGQLRRKLAALPKTDPMRPLARALLEGESLAESGGRHNAIRDLTWWLAERGKAASPAVAAELFGPSLAAMRRDSPGDAPTLEEVWAAYESAARKIVEAERTAAERRAEEGRRRARQTQIEAAGASGYYDDEDLARIAAAHGWEPEELRDRWLIQREGMWWLLDSEGAYRGPYLKDDAAVAATRILARAPVRLMEATKTGASYRSLADVVRESGQVAERVVSDLVVQRTWYDPIEMELHEAVRPLRQLEPKFDERIDAWLRTMAGEQHARLVDWLACVPDLSKLLCAVYFDGAPGSGKSLLATGLAHLWTDGPPADIELVLSDFNDELVRCPLVLADEEIPRRYRSSTVTTTLRSMIGSLQRTLKRKFKPPTDLVGAVRLVLAANNEFLLDSKEVASSQDLDAVAQRFLYINVPSSATDYLNALPRRIREAWARDGIARHSLWLRANHPVEVPGKRFWVEGDMSQMHRLLMTGSTWNSRVCEWLVRYLMSPSAFDRGATGLIRRGGGELLVNDQAILDRWELYHRNTHVDPETGKVGAALRALSLSSRRRQLRNGSSRTRYRLIDVDHLLAWSDRHNIGDREAILAAVGEPGSTGVSDDGPFEDLGTLPPADGGEGRLL